MSLPVLDPLERLAGELRAPAPARRMRVVVNPYATTVSDRLRNLVVYALAGRYEVEALDTTGRGHATELARAAAADGVDVVVAFGGDGTVNEVANGLVGSRTALSCLPGGATNVFCRMLGISPDIVDATEQLLRLADLWSPREVDLGAVNGRHFCFSAGFGLDASVVRRVDAHPRLKRRGREWYFAYAACTTFARRYLVDPPLIDVQAGGQRVGGVTAVVQNGTPWTYFGRRPIEVAEGVELGSGSLTAAVLRRANPIDVPTFAWRVFSSRRRVLDHRQVSGLGPLRVLRAAARDGRALPVQVDGDYVGDAPAAEFRVLPGALRVVAPG